MKVERIILSPNTQSFLITSDEIFTLGSFCNVKLKKRSMETGHAWRKGAHLSKLPSGADPKMPLLEGMPEFQEVEKAISNLRIEVSKLRDPLNKLKDSIENWTWKDKISEMYRSLFSKERIIEPSKSNDEIIEDMRFRTKHNTPPAYKDAAKIDQGIGDLIIWHSIVDLGRIKNQNVVFVTNDEKNDWSTQSNKVAIFARAELAMEFNRATNHNLLIINWKRFLQSMNAGVKTIEEADKARRLPARSRSEHILLDEISTILGNFSEQMNDANTEEINVDDITFPLLVDELEVATTKLLHSGIAEVRITLLNKIIQTLRSIQSEQFYVTYCLVSMKDSPETHQQQILQHINTFRVLHASYIHLLSNRT